MTIHEPHAQDDGVDTPAVPEPPIEEESAREPEASAEVHETPSEAGLFADSDVTDLRARWAGVQAAFVDNPQDCVRQADHLVSDLVDQLTNGFAKARSRLEEEWSQGREASTEDLRMALMHYREFFDRLLTV